MSTLQLQPIAVGTNNSWSLAAGSGKVAAVDLPNDDDTSFIILGYPTLARQSFTLTASRGVPTTATGITVTGYTRSASLTGNPSQEFKIFAKNSAGTTEFTSSLFGSFNWTDYSGTLTNPSGGAWTPADINDLNLELGIRVASWASNDSVECTTLYLVASFTLGLPSATTNAATNVTATTVTLNGTVNPNGATSQFPVSYRFQWGPTTAYGNLTTLTSGLTGSADVAVSANLTGLSPNTTYHFRVKATGDSTVNGADQTFTTGNAVDTALMVF